MNRLGGVGIARLTLAALVSGIVVPVALGAQEPELRRFEVLPGLRLTFGNSLGASLQATWNTPRRFPTLSLQMFSFSTSWTTKHSGTEHYERFFMGRLKSAIGKGEGGSLFAFLDRGVAFYDRKNEERKYVSDVWGLGIGLGLTAGRLATALEFGIGEIHRPDIPVYLQMGVEFQIRL